MNEASSCSPVGAFVFWRCIVLLRHVCAVVYSGGLDTGGCSNASHFPFKFFVDFVPASAAINARRVRARGLDFAKRRVTPPERLGHLTVQQQGQTPVQTQHSRGIHPAGACRERQLRPPSALDWCSATIAKISRKQASSRAVRSL